ncbi:MAG: DUF3047 domain-containing protein [Desulfocapsaceae bacterium]|nr:DUF3047 domain-containing protein [Desulfocapsaceae bacterium]
MAGMDAVISWGTRILLVLWLGVIPIAGAESAEIAVGRFAVDGLSGWVPKSFKGQTAYRLVSDQGRWVVEANSHAAASGLIREIHFNPREYRYLRWSWKVAHTISGGDERSRSGDDYAARVYVVFPGRFFWQTRAVNYIWANILPQGQSLPNPYSAGVMMVAVESGAARTGQWVAEERDMLADYRRLFGEDPGEAEAIAIMTDTDDTGTDATAWYGDIVIATKP